MSLLSIVIIGFICIIIGTICIVAFENDWFAAFIIIGIMMIVGSVFYRVFERLNQPPQTYECNIDFSNSSDENVTVIDYDIEDNIAHFTFEDDSETYLHLRDNDSVSCVRSD